MVANFPAGFSEAAAARLTSIVASGARCGVYTLMSVDTQAADAAAFPPRRPGAAAMNLSWREGRSSGSIRDLGPLPLAFARRRRRDSPDRPRRGPRGQGRQSRGGALRVHRARASRVVDRRQPRRHRRAAGPRRGHELQHFELGKGTSQHVLIAGKTGSGKSTLLHVLITNLALRYSPDEVEAVPDRLQERASNSRPTPAGLPHARVVAIESEREFGLSVLERLDVELAAAATCSASRACRTSRASARAEPAARLPRILLIVDEFQELFVEDDRIAQDASLLLDRLVRQGRAFGIHVLLGSQTLGGAYSLARSTIGQMAVRIALQCSEADAHLILSEENTAARLLTRPGEAIYNDANGVYEGNHPFQVVWLADAERDDYLQRIAEYAATHGHAAGRTIVFEGNVLSDPADNVALHDLLAAPRWPETAAGPPKHGLARRSPSASPPTPSSCAERQQPAAHRPSRRGGTGRHGCCDDESGRAARERHARFYVLDGTRPDAPEVGFWKRLAPVVPHATKIAGPRNAPELLAEIAAELALRQEQGQDQTPPLYLFDLQRWAASATCARRRISVSASSDDGKPPSPAKLFTTILREGPALGIHTLMWCDTYNTLNRLVDRQSLRNFELRVLFQMNATDSSNLMDSPDASRLGVHRAIFYDEAQGRMEKFRPYGLPAEDWLQWVRGQLRGRE